MENSKLIVFLGSMNAMPMMYALELKSKGYDVLYFVDTDVKNRLCRPENHFKQIQYPYPNWIVEINLKTQILLPIFKEYFYRKIQSQILKYSNKRVACFIVNGFFISLTPTLKKNNDTKIIALSHGSDICQWANISIGNQFIQDFSKKSIFKYIPNYLSIKTIKKIIYSQYFGLTCCNAVINFPKGMNQDADKIICSLENLGIIFIPRYDISFYVMEDQIVRFKKKGKALNIFSGVRFSFKDFVGDATGRNKGTDKIILGLAEFYKQNPNMEVHFIEKGSDLLLAKKLCDDSGLTPCITWHKEMPLDQLFTLYQQADICFDQVGDHWIGAIGAYALWLGKPLIANDITLVNASVFPAENPIQTADSVATIVQALNFLSNEASREKISNISVSFARDFFSPVATTNKIIKVIEE